MLYVSTLFQTLAKFDHKSHTTPRTSREKISDKRRRIAELSGGAEPRTQTAPIMESTPFMAFRKALSAACREHRAGVEFKRPVRAHVQRPGEDAYFVCGPSALATMTVTGPGDRFVGSTPARRRRSERRLGVRRCVVSKHNKSSQNEELCHDCRELDFQRIFRGIIRGCRSLQRIQHARHGMVVVYIRRKDSAERAACSMYRLFASVNSSAVKASLEKAMPICGAQLRLGPTRFRRFRR